MPEESSHLAGPFTPVSPTALAQRDESSEERQAPIEALSRSESDPRPEVGNVKVARPLLIRRLGRVPYGQALALQEALVTRRQRGEIDDTLLLLEHAPVVTLGRSADRANVLLSREALQARGVALFETGRGGDVTYHGPGQVIGYPIVDLSPDRRDVHRYVRDLEDVMIRVCSDYALAAHRVPGMSGCWVGSGKIGAIGVRIARWVTSHGFAFNVATDLDAFGLIVPCGIADRTVTSLAAQLGREVPLPEVMDRIADSFVAVFERQPVSATDPISTG